MRGPPRPRPKPKDRNEQIIKTVKNLKVVKHTVNGYARVVPALAVRSKNRIMIGFETGVNVRPGEILMIELDKRGFYDDEKRD